MAKILQILALLALFLPLAPPGDAQMMTMGIGQSGPGGGGCTPGKLDFSQACNSGWIL